MDIQGMVKITHKGQRVLTSAQLAEIYGVTTDVIKRNFANAREYFIEGVHFFKLVGEELRLFREAGEKFSLGINRYTSHLCIWTAQGAARHAKMINSETAWAVFDELEKFYFEQHVEREMQEELPFAKRWSAGARKLEEKNFKEFKAAQKNKPVEKTAEKVDLKLLAEFINHLDEPLKSQIVREIISEIKNSIRS